jgi:hypothetical protein
LTFATKYSDNLKPWKKNIEFKCKISNEKHTKFINTWYSYNNHEQNKGVIIAASMDDGFIESAKPAFV